ncbi:ATP-binding protein [Heyndrickxia oleronia]|uniref:ATP-binding protein n=1 Tax=Heyndrickxia oleronia TaxID=38875 RepID=A0AAW6SSR1_9BACI|nr:ATP-binding protein [Heyndrickxia oleronia]MDH5159877.1 ATP-binding protein [Heyndrickxia oleronia]
MNTNESRCLLANGCKVAGTAQCNDNCAHFTAIHGRSGSGGRVAAAGTPADYRLLTLANSPARDSQQEIYRGLPQYIETFERMFDGGTPRIKSMYLWSAKPGTGKTTTAAVLLNEWIRRHYSGSLKRGDQPLQQPAYFLDTNEWQTLYNEFNRSHVPQEVAERASREYYRRLASAKQARFAVLDDIGVRTATEGFRGDLHSVINHRTVNGLPTVYTSNLPIEDMARVFDARLYDRMRDQCIVFEFGGESKRGRR